MARLALAYAKEPRNFWGKNKRMCVLCVESLKRKETNEGRGWKKMEKPSVWIQQFTFWLLRSNSN